MFLGEDIEPKEPREEYHDDDDYGGENEEGHYNGYDDGDYDQHDA